MLKEQTRQDVSLFSLRDQNFLRSINENKLHFPCNQYVGAKIGIFMENAKNISPIWGPLFFRSARLPLQRSEKQTFYATCKTIECKNSFLFRQKRIRIPINRNTDAPENFGIRNNALSLHREFRTIGRPSDFWKSHTKQTIQLFVCKI